MCSIKTREGEKREEGNRNKKEEKGRPSITYRKQYQMADFNPIKSKMTLGVKHLNIKSNRDKLSASILKTYNYILST